jgi:hypothetical protein
MKIHCYLVLLIMLQSGFVVAQTGIGTKKPDESSVLDVDSKEKGLLIPRMTSDERDLIKNPANALIIYNSTLMGIQINIGTKVNPNWVLAGGNGTNAPPVNNLASGSIFIGNNDGIAKEVPISGEASLSNSGEIRIDNTAVISKKLTGYVRNAGKISHDDTIIQAIQKLEGNQSINVVVSLSNDYNLLSSDYTIFCDTEMGSFTIYLPEVSSCPGKVYVITKIDESSNELYINPPIKLSKTTTVSYLNYPKTFKIQSDGKAWYIIN